jgi:hypothetical protein
MESEALTGEESRTGLRWLWFAGGCILSVSTLCSLVLLVLLLISTGINAYLAWTLSGYEVSVYRPVPVSPTAVVVTPTAELALVPTPTPKAPTLTATSTSTPMSASTTATLEVQIATLAAIATRAAEIEAANTPGSTPIVVGPETPQAAATPVAKSSTVPTESPTEAVAASTSTNTYNLIPIDGERESRPPEEHGDLNLKLRDPQPADFEATLVEIPGSGVDPNAPKLSAVFEPDFVQTYAVHNWDWGCNCKGDLIEDGSAVVIGIKTTPGEPIFAPKTERDIYDGKYYAVVLYASEDQLTAQYARVGNVAQGYTVHYLGLQTDPNLVKAFEESKGSQLPGLTLDTPVGVAASDEVIVAMRDNGKFLDARSKLDWWE